MSIPRIPPDGPSPDGFLAWRAFLRAHAAAVGRIEREMAASEPELPLTWYDVLVALVGATERRLRLRELANEVLLSRSGLTRLVDRLETAGLLRREPDPTDRRGAFAVLTDAGYEALRRTWPLYARGIQEQFARHLEGDEAAILARALQRVADARERPSPSNGPEARET
ncbi:MAG TPA: MarR family transcriptional regulator [Chloroflexota bacterium]|nr:MarR family transcriptional regulator [Chloroflexota bacterium]